MDFGPEALRVTSLTCGNIPEGIGSTVSNKPQGGRSTGVWISESCHPFSLEALPFRGPHFTLRNSNAKGSPLGQIVWGQGLRINPGPADRDPIFVRRPGLVTSPDVAFISQVHQEMEGNGNRVFILGRAGATRQNCNCVRVGLIQRAKQYYGALFTWQRRLLRVRVNVGLDDFS